jgi:hypothetical protein
MGGHVFKDPVTRAPLTSPIKQEDIPATVMWVELLTKIRGLSENLLGSAGIAATSNDIDIAVNEFYHTKDSIYHRVLEYVKHQHPADPVKLWVTRTGNSVHIRTPVCGNRDFGYVQVDLMFGDPHWLKWSLRGETTAGFKGRHRHILLASITKYRGYRWSATKGVLTRDGILLSNRIDAIPSYVLGNNKTVDDLYSIDSIMHCIKQNPDWQKMVAEAEETLGHEGLSLMEKYDG